VLFSAVINSILIFLTKKNVSLCYFSYYSAYFKITHIGHIIARISVLFSAIKSAVCSPLTQMPRRRKLRKIFDGTHFHLLLFVSPKDSQEKIGEFNGSLYIFRFNHKNIFLILNVTI